MVRRMMIAPEVFLGFRLGNRFEVVADPVPRDAAIVKRGVTPDGYFFLDIESPAFDLTDPLTPTLRSIGRGVPPEGATP